MWNCVKVSSNWRAVGSNGHELSLQHSDKECLRNTLKPEQEYSI